MKTLTVFDLSSDLKEIGAVRSVSELTNSWRAAATGLAE